MIIRDVKFEDFRKNFRGELKTLKESQQQAYKELVDYILSGGCQSAAFEQDGELMGIMQWLEYSPRCLYVAIFPAEAISKHRVTAARFVKKFFYHLAECYQCERIETTSIDSDFLNKWHKFIGFELEGKKRKYAYGIDYNMWGVVFDGCGNGDSSNSSGA